jgi:hypothetical protein
MPVRDAKRRGYGWLAGYADIGWTNSLGWYEGFGLLTAVDSTGVITGLCFGSASTADQQLAETFFAVRARPNRRLISVGSIASGPYVADKGFRGRREPPPVARDLWGTHHPSAEAQRSQEEAMVQASMRRRVAAIRQIVESVYDKLFNAFGLWGERPP